MQRGKRSLRRGCYRDSLPGKWNHDATRRNRSSRRPRSPIAPSGPRLLDQRTAGGITASYAQHARTASSRGAGATFVQRNFGVSIRASIGQRRHVVCGRTGRVQDRRRPNRRQRLRPTPATGIRLLSRGGLTPVCQLQKSSRQLRTRPRVLVLEDRESVARAGAVRPSEPLLVPANHRMRLPPKADRQNIANRRFNIARSLATSHRARFFARIDRRSRTAADSRQWKQT